MDDLIDRLEAEAARNGGDGAYAWRSRDLCGKAAAELRTLRAERDAEVAEIVAWLRTRWGDGPDFLADLIERGEYKEPKA